MALALDPNRTFVRFNIDHSIYIYFYFNYLFSFIPEQECNWNKLAGSSHLLNINVEGFERSFINEASFMEVNTEGKIKTLHRMKEQL